MFFEAAIEVKAVMMPHTVPNRPIYGPAEPMEAREQQARFEPLDLAVDGDVELLLDALGERLDLTARALEGALPLAHRGDEDGGEAGGRAVVKGAEQLLQGAAGPERVLEGVHLAADAAEQERLVDDDRPAPQPTR